MKFHLRILLLLSTLFSLLGAELVTTYFPNGALKAQTHYKKGTNTEKKVGIKEGIEKVYYEMGAMAYEVNYSDNKRDGLLVWFDKEGKKLAEMFYRNGKLEGYEKTYFLSGTLKHIVLYKNDMKEGKQKEFFDNGHVALEVIYKHNKKEGIQKEYTPDGKIYTKVAYQNNYKEGQQIWFDSNGKQMKTILYKMDRPINIMKKVQEKKEERNVLIDSINFSPQKVR